MESVLEIEMACHDVPPPLQRMEYTLHGWVAYLILPLFALANAGLVLKGIDIGSAIAQSITLGIALRLAVGKPLGIVAFTYVAVKGLKVPLPTGVRWGHVLGVSMLGGIGFTMSLFISGLSFTAPDKISFSKLGIIAGSIASAVGGMAFLYLSSGSKVQKAAQ